MSEGSDPHALELVLAYDANVVPRFTRAFGEMLLAAVDLPTRANLLDLACRTGYPATQLLELAHDGRVIAIDADSKYLELARARAGEELGRRIFFKQSSASVLGFSNEVFTNVVGNLIDRVTPERGTVLAEAARVLRVGGQLVVTQCLRGSFAEIVDLLREVALRHDLPLVNERVDQYVATLPTPEAWQTEVEARGFERIRVDTRTFHLAYASGRELFADPVVQAAALAEWRWCAEGSSDPDGVLYRVQEAIDVYFQGRSFELAVVAGCVSARRGGALRGT